jgi:hypothetical protein
LLLFAPEIAGLYKYFHDDRQLQRESIAKVSETWIDNAEALVEIDKQWNSRVALINQILQPSQTIPGIDNKDKEAVVSKEPVERPEDKKRREEIVQQIDSLPIILDKCLEKKECDEDRMVEQFCIYIYKLGFIYDFRNFSDDVIASTISEQLREAGDSKPLTQKSVVDSLSYKNSISLDSSPKNTALRNLIRRCNGNNDQRTLYRWYFDAAFQNKPAAAKPKPELLNVDYDELAPND